METFFVYLIKSSVCVLLYELFYRLFLRGETFHRLNRIVLLMSLVLSLLLPLFDVSGWFVAASQDRDLPFAGLTISLQELAVEQKATALSEPSGMTLSTVLFGVYLTGVVLLLLKNLFIFVYLHRLLKRCCQKQTADGQVYYQYSDRIGPFSWLGRVVLSSADDEALTSCILAHERAHVLLGHSLDLLLIELFLCFQWFNPAVWWLKKDLRLVHEYEADRYVLSSGFDACTYQLLLIRKSVGPKLYNMVHSFNNYSLKKRITMMMKRKSRFWTQAKSLYVLPLGGFVLSLFACVDGKKPFVQESQPMEAQSVEPQSAKPQEAPVKEQQRDTVAAFQEEQQRVTTTTPVKEPVKKSSEKDASENLEDPSFPGGDVACMKWLTNNINYPKEAMEKGIEGRVIVRFVVTKNGKITNAEVVRPVDPLLETEALRVIRSMPDWIPGKRNGQNVDLQFTLPITFRLQ